tara:strand:+ start:991 stop:1299 length:309 start_codon:yes stop_codon:yes gene_type:complete
METNMFIGIFIGATVVALLGFIAYRVRLTFDRIDQQMTNQIAETFSAIRELEESILKDTSSITGYVDDISRNMDNRFAEIYSTIDSRFDKQESRLKKELTKD